MVPLDSLVRTKETTAPQVISHFNLFRSAEVSGNAAPGVSSGEAMDTMAALAAQIPGTSVAWSDLSYQERLLEETWPGVMS